MTVLTGIAYPLLTTGIAQLIFPNQANGSILYKNGQSVGSSLIGQKFEDPKYFHSRPSAAGKDGYDATSSSGSNLGPTNENLLKSMGERAQMVRTENGLSINEAVPSDLVTASGSGLDPHITPEAAFLQVERIAKIRNLPAASVKDLVQKHVSSRQLGFLGEPHVNVLELNLDLNNLR